MRGTITQHETRFETELGSDIRIRIESTFAGDRAYSIWFDSEANIKAETHGDKLMMGYCRTCIIISELIAMGMEDMLAWNECERMGLLCECED